MDSANSPSECASFQCFSAVQTLPILDLSDLLGLVSTREAPYVEAISKSHRSRPLVNTGCVSTTY